MLDNIHSQLSTLIKAIHHPNLSVAAENIGVSQPQLSRIIAKLEEETGLNLFDRGSRRKAGWTPIAFKLAATYLLHKDRLQKSLAELQRSDLIKEIRIGTLEGLNALAVDFCAELMEIESLKRLQIDVFDLSELEEHFNKSHLDLIFTVRFPRKTKFAHHLVLGYQDLVASGKGKYIVQSPFEQQQNRRKKMLENSKLIVSNSLELKKLWIEKKGAAGFVPSPVRKKRSHGADELPVYLIGQEILSPLLWTHCQKVKWESK